MCKPYQDRTTYRGKGYKRRQHMERERSNDELAITNFVSDEAANDDSEAETSEARAADGSEFVSR